MISLIRPMVVIFAVLTAVTGLAYPAVMTAFGQAVFHDQANGSMIEKDGKVMGSRLIGQQFDAPQYFWGRLSATSPMPYNAQGSSGSNLGPVNPALADEVKGRLDALKAAGHMPVGVAVPVDLVTSSGSGLDPNISPQGALIQVKRIAKERKLDEAKVKALVESKISTAVVGPETVNVLELNVALDELK